MSTSPPVAPILGAADCYPLGDSCSKNFLAGARFPLALRLWQLIEPICLASPKAEEPDEL